MISMSKGLSLSPIVSQTRKMLGTWDLRMSRWPDEVQARMYPQIALVTPLRLLLLPHVDLVLVINEIDDGRP